MSAGRAGHFQTRRMAIELNAQIVVAEDPATPRSRIDAEPWIAWSAVDARETLCPFRRAPSLVGLKPRMRAMTLLVILLAITTADAEGSSPGAARFSGNASLSTSPQQSADKRYSVKAALKADPTQQTGRFAIRARLFADAQTAEGICGVAGDLIFADGFEN